MSQPTDDLTESQRYEAAIFPDHQTGFWTHAHQGTCPECKVIVTSYGIGSPTPPWELLERDGFASIDTPCICCSERYSGRVHMMYVTSWDHEPSSAEKVAAGLESIDWLGWDDDVSDDEDVSDDAMRVSFS